MKKALLALHANTTFVMVGKCKMQNNAQTFQRIHWEGETYLCVRVFVSVHSGPDLVAFFLFKQTEAKQRKAKWTAFKGSD